MRRLLLAILSLGLVTTTALALRTPADAASAAPKVTSVSLRHDLVSGGNRIGISGHNFTQVTQVRIGGVIATHVLVSSSTHLAVTVPAHRAGTVTVVVYTRAGRSAANAASEFTYHSTAYIGSASASAGPVSGGTRITFQGKGLTRVTSVAFGSVVVTPNRRSATTLIVFAPRHSARKVTLAFRLGGGLLVQSPAPSFTFLERPTLDSVSPSAGATTAGQTVTLHGSNFTSTTQVIFGSTFASHVKVSSSGKLTAVTPNHAATGVAVRVKTRGGTSASAVHYSFLPKPTISAVSPSVVPAKSGTTVMLTGSSLAQAKSVKFGGQSGTSITQVSSSRITVKTPSTITGRVAVTVTTPGGTSAGTSFTFIGPPQISAVYPSAIASTGGTVTLEGTDFTGVSSVALSVLGNGTLASLNAAFAPDAAGLSITVPALPASYPTGLYAVDVTAVGGTSRYYLTITSGQPSSSQVADADYDWWASPNAVDDGTITWLGSITHGGMTQVTRSDRANGITTTVDLGSIDNDEHDTPALALDTSDPNKPVIAFYTGHNNDKLIRYRTVDRNSLALGPLRTLTFGQAVTYVQVLQYQNTVMLLTRAGSSSWDYRISADWGQTWSTERVLINGTPYGQVYSLVRATSAPGMYEVVFYGHPVNSSIHDIFFGYVSLATNTLQDAVGNALGSLTASPTGSNPLGGPGIDPQSLTKAVANPAGSGVRLLDVGMLGGAPAVLYAQWYLTGDQAATYHVARFTGGTWNIQPWSQPSGPPFGYNLETHYIGGATFGPDDRIYVAWQDDIDGNGTEQPGLTYWHTGSASWDAGTQDLGRLTVLRTSNDAQARPIVPANSVTGTTKLIAQELPYYGGYSDYYAISTFIDTIS
jgi:hypothetical protein